MISEWYWTISSTEMVKLMTENQLLLNWELIESVPFHLLAKAVSSRLNHNMQLRVVHHIWIKFIFPKSGD